MPRRCSLFLGPRRGVGSARHRAQKDYAAQAHSLLSASRLLEPAFAGPGQREGSPIRPTKPALGVASSRNAVWAPAPLCRGRCLLPNDRSDRPGDKVNVYMVSGEEARPKAIHGVRAARMARSGYSTYSPGDWFCNVSIDAGRRTGRTKNTFAKACRCTGALHNRAGKPSFLSDDASTRPPSASFCLLRSRSVIARPIAASDAIDAGRRVGPWPTPERGESPSRIRTNGAPSFLFNA
jgi:hypothetical protein